MTTVFEKSEQPISHPLGTPDPNREAIDRALALEDVMIGGEKVGVDLARAITGFDVVQSTRTASYIEVTVRDPAREILRSSLLASKPELLVDGRSFKYVRMDVNEDRSLVLTFEAKAVNRLRHVKKPRSANRATMTRAHFIGHGVTPYAQFVCPEIDLKYNPARPSQTASEAKAARTREPGLPPTGSHAAKGITVKHVQATPSQLRAIQAVLDTGTALKLQDTLLLAALMAATQESTFNVDATNSSDHVGLFQMSGPGSGPGLDKGTVTQRKDPVYASKWFYANALKHQIGDSLGVEDLYGANPWVLSWKVEAPSNNPRDVALYGQWFDEAKATLAAYKGGDIATQATTAEQAATDANVTTKGFIFSVGAPAGKAGESEWDADLRMAAEVNWYLWENDASVYFISGRWLLKSQPRIEIHPDDEALVSLAGAVDEAQRANDLTLKVRADRWGVPHGTIALLTDWGPLSGRWFIGEVRWSLFSRDTTVELETIKTPKQEPNVADQSLATTTPTSTATPVTATGTDLRNLVLADTHIDLKSYSIKNYTDVQGSLITEDVMRGMLAITDGGFDILITALKSNHGIDGPNGHNPGGKAMDIGRVNGQITRLGSSATSDLMLWLKANQQVLGWRQMFGPIAALNYDSPGHAWGSVYPGHENHVHVGW